VLPAPTLSSSGRGGKCRRIGVVTTGDVATTTRGVVVGQAKSTCGGRGRRTGERGLGDFNSLGFPSTQFTQRCTRDLASTEAGLVVNVGVGSRVVGALAMTRGDVGGAIVGGAGLQRTGTAEREGSINQGQRENGSAEGGSGCCGTRLYTHRFDGERGGGAEDCAAGLLLCRVRVPSVACSSWTRAHSELQIIETGTPCDISDHDAGIRTKKGPKLKKF